MTIKLFVEEDLATVSNGYPKALVDDLINKAPTLTYVNTDNGVERVLLSNLGKKADVSARSIKKALKSSLSMLSSRKLVNATFEIHSNLIHEEKDLTHEKIAKVVMTAIHENNYKFDKFLTKKESKSTPLEEANILIQSTTVQLDELLQKKSVILSARKRAQDFVNERADIATPAWYENEAKKIVEEHKNVLNMKTIQFDELKEIGMNMFAAVGQAATVPPRLVVIEYNGNPSSHEKIALVGKGITFDTGGLNLKPTGYMEDMYVDNHGAATVLGALKAIAELGIKKNLVVALCLAENSISERAYLPGSIIKSYNGKTVEIGNTDAEGRLVLGDGLTYIQKHYNPTHVIDVATLTGACVVALGEHAAGMFTNDVEFGNEIVASGKKVDEVLWPLPILEEHVEEIKGKESDIKNTGKGRYGGASTAAAFLKEFIEKDVKWVHLDIAGPSKIGDNTASGFGVESLVEWVQTTDIGK